MPTDSLGRQRRPGQNRGLRPLYPRLPRGLSSRSVRVAMSEFAWRVLERHLATSTAPTRPRALGELIERALTQGRPDDWQRWQITKERRLLEAS